MLKIKLIRKLLSELSTCHNAFVQLICHINYYIELIKKISCI